MTDFGPLDGAAFTEALRLLLEHHPDPDRIRRIFAVNPLEQFLVRPMADDPEKLQVILPDPEAEELGGVMVIGAFPAALVMRADERPG
jgi:hypothetical protein